MILDCTSTDTGIQSIANILGIDINQLHDIFRDIGPVPIIEAPEYFIPPEVYKVVEKPDFPIPSVWFHATRVVAPERFRREGILPKREVRGRLYDFLKDLSQGLQKSGKYPHGISTAWKNDNEEDDQGPFAFLFKLAAIEAPGATHAYHNAPELVEDIAGSLLGANFRDLVARFQDNTVPCIVSFKAHIGEHKFKRALWFAHMIWSGSNALDAADAANTFYVGTGSIIPPGDIIDVEILS